MILFNEKFHENFLGFVKSKDMSLSKDSIISELGILLAYDRKDVITVVEGSGVPLPRNPSNENIAHAIIENIGGNRKLQKGLAYLIVESNEPETVSNDTGDILDWVNKAKTNTLTDKEKADAGLISKGGDKLTPADKGAIAGSVADAIGSIFGFAKSVKDAKSQKESDKSQLIQAMLLAKSGGGKKSNTGLWITLTIVGIAVIGTVLFFTLKKPVVKVPAAV